MSKELVIDFLENGEAQAMHVDSFDLGFLGNKKVQRATEIKFNETTQSWGLYLPMKALRLFEGAAPSYAPVHAAQGFPSYEVARQAEVLWLNVCRALGEEPNSDFGLGVIARIKIAMAAGTELTIADWQ